MSTVASRLRGAIDKWGGINRFAAEMEGRPIRGTSRQMIYRYISRQRPTPPPIEFLEEAAEVLGVRVAWLAFDEGESTEEKEEARRESSALSGAVVSRDGWREDRAHREALRLKHAALRALGVPETAEEKHNREWLAREHMKQPDALRAEALPLWIAPLAEACRRQEVAMSMIERDRTVDHGPAATAAVCDALKGPLAALGIDAASMQARGTLSDYILSMVPNLLHLAREGHRQRVDAYASPATEPENENG
jgi:hypothetical protein